MAQELINIGTTPNDGSGDPLRVAFAKINNNFTQLFATGFATYETTTYDNTANQTILEFPANLMTQATFQINSSNPDTNDSQNITLNASISNDGTSVQWTGHSTIFINNPVTQYDVTIDNVSGNVKLLVSPLVNATLNHFISSQVEVSNFVYGTPMAIEGLSGAVLVTQSNIPITTEQPV
jgi:hypothetical protein